MMNDLHKSKIFEPLLSEKNHEKRKCIDTLEKICQKLARIVRGKRIIYEMDDEEINETLVNSATNQDVNWNEINQAASGTPAVGKPGKNLVSRSQYKATETSKKKPFA